MTDARLPGRAKTPPTSIGSFGGISSGASSRSASQIVAAGSIDPAPAAMRAARRRWATGVAVLTTLEGDLLRGATVSSVTPLSIAPPLVAVALESEGRMAKLIDGSGVFAISILDRAHEFQSDRFSGYGPQPDGRFTGIGHDLGVTSCPILHGALAWYECRVHQTLETGDHLLVIGEVLATGLGDDTDDPLLNYEGAYRRIEGA